MSLTEELCRGLGVPALANKLWIVLASAATFQCIKRVSRSIFTADSCRLARVARWYRELSDLQKNDWDIRVASTVHALFCVYVARVVSYDSILQADKLFGNSEYVNTLYAVCTGYFLWDVVMCLRYWKIHGILFTFHGATCLLMLILSFRPLGKAFGSVFCLYELSTPFLNLSWFFEKSGRSGTRLQKAVFLLFGLSFFLTRIINGAFLTRDVFVVLKERGDKVPQRLSAFGVCSLIGLNLLNMYWFKKICRILTRRLSGNGKNSGKEPNKALQQNSDLQQSSAVKLKNS